MCVTKLYTCGTNVSCNFPYNYINVMLETEGSASTARTDYSQVSGDCCNKHTREERKVSTRWHLLFAIEATQDHMAPMVDIL